jgi:Ca2+/H+ antiporter
MMLLGTTLVVVFSYPMVGVIDEMGDRLGIRSFYVAFVLAPVASNASELTAAYKYASKKTSKSIKISLSTLVGSAAMNNA